MKFQAIFSWMAVLALQTGVQNRSAHDALDAKISPNTSALKVTDPELGLNSNLHLESEQLHEKSYEPAEVEEFYKKFQPMEEAFKFALQSKNISYMQQFQKEFQLEEQEDKASGHVRWYSPSSTRDLIFKLGVFDAALAKSVYTHDQYGKGFTPENVNLCPSFPNKGQWLTRLIQMHDHILVHHAEPENYKGHQVPIPAGFLEMAEAMAFTETSKTKSSETVKSSATAKIDESLKNSGEHQAFTQVLTAKSKPRPTRHPTRAPTEYPTYTKDPNYKVETYSPMGGVGPQAMLINSPHQIFFVARGTDFSDVKDVVANLDFRPSTSHLTHGFIHRGFMDYFLKFDKAFPGGLKDHFFARSGNRKDKRIVVVGHSQGGAIADITAYFLVRKWGFTNVRIATFGAARALSKGLADEMNNHYCNKGILHCLRWANQGDYVTSLPYASWGFGHVGQAIRIKQWNWKWTWKFWTLFSRSKEGGWVQLGTEEVYWVSDWNFGTPVTELLLLDHHVVDKYLEDIYEAAQGFHLGNVINDQSIWRMYYKAKFVCE